MRKFKLPQSKYARQMLNANIISLRFSNEEHGELRINITYSSNNIVRIILHDNVPMVIIMQHNNYAIK